MSASQPVVSATLSASASKSRAQSVQTTASAPNGYQSTKTSASQSVKAEASATLAIGGAPQSSSPNSPEAPPIEASITIRESVQGVLASVTNFLAPSTEPAEELEQDRPGQIIDRVA